MTVSVLGVDVGGTKVAAGPVARNGGLLAAPLVEPSSAEDFESFLSSLEATLCHALSEFSSFGIGAIGLACAGTVDSRGGVVVTSPNLPLRKVGLAGIITDALGVPAVLENDANAAVLGEALAGAGRGLRNVVMLTLGTGVGGGLFLDGRLFRGTGGGAGELGHTIVCAGGEPCRCGSRGCLEMYASGTALARLATAYAGDAVNDPEAALQTLREKDALTGGAVSRLAQKGHPGALEAVTELAGWLGLGLVNLTNTFNPDMIVIGGGVAQLGELLVGPAREAVGKLAIVPNRDQVAIVGAALGNTAGLVGAALVGWEALEADESSSGKSASRIAGQGRTKRKRVTG